MKSTWSEKDQRLLADANARTENVAEWIKAHK